MSEQFRPNRRGLTRRHFIGTSAAAGGVAAAGLTGTAAVAQERTVKIGYVTPQSGPLAGFAEADDFTIQQLQDTFANGIEVNGTTYKIEVIVADSQSNPNRAAEVALDLIVDEEIDLMVVASTPDTTNPVSTQCEIEGQPCISTMAPWDAWYVGRQANPGDPSTWEQFEWTYHFFWGGADYYNVTLNMWSQLEHGNVVGALWPNDADGNAFADPNAGFPPVLEANGYELVDPGRFPNGTDSFASQISTFQDAGIDVVTGLMIPPDFTTYWTQSIQQGYKPKICTMGRAILFPSAVEALGDTGHNLSCEVWWSTSHPFNSSITGQSASELAAAFEESTGRPWTQPIGYVHALFEVALDVISRAADPNDRDALVEAIAATNVETIIGPVAFNGTGVPEFAAKNVSTAPLVGGQWRLKEDGSGYDIVIVDNQSYPDIPTGGEMEPIV
ncbi:ABC transporter substrate-binding protein [Pseudoroseicyclus sp. H15]